METTVLDKKVHGRLIQEMDRISAMARVPAHFIGAPINGNLTDPEYDWFLNVRTHVRHNVYGLAVTRRTHNGIPSEQRMMAACGWLLRNFIDARTYSLQDIVKLDDNTQPRVMFILNLASVSAEPADWIILKLESLLLSRMASQQLTVVTMDNIGAVRSSFGSTVAGIIQSHFIVL